jgi:hypothetical protein
MKNRLLQPTPLRVNLASRFRQIGKDIWKFCLHLIFFFPCGFVFGIVTPLHFAHLVVIILGDFL